MTTEHPDPARSFGGVADAYDRGRPTYPRAAATWLTGDRPLSVLELGAGTGKLTEQLVALGHDVHATEPDPQMLAILEKRLPQVRVSRAPAEEIPAGDASYDVVISGQAFHWFDLDRALPEIARVLRPGGRHSLVWNQRDERIPWVKRLGRIIGTQDQLRDPAEALTASGLFGEVETETFKFWQVVDRNSIQDLVRSRSNIATLSPAEQEAKMAEVLTFYDDFGRGMDGMQVPYATSCFRAQVLDRVTPTLTDTRSADDSGQVSDGSSTDMLLIDFK
jgi:ubiquinone/menaquinone biosynthesis C-methylase UbiE